MPISPERWETVKELFGETLGVEPEARAAFIATRAQGDAEVEREVASLLDALDDAADRFERPAIQSLGSVDEADLPTAPSRVGGRIGPYHVTREIGHGGMGTIYEANRADDQYHKRV